jgi:hypothetical protein
MMQLLRRNIFCKIVKKDLEMKVMQFCVEIYFAIVTEQFGFNE